MGKKDEATGQFHGGKAIVKAVISLPQDAFKLSGTGAKTSILYRARLLRDLQLQETRDAVNGLRGTRGEQPHKPLDMADLEAAESLKSAKTLVRDRLDAWAAEGEQQLAPTGVSFTRWRTVIAALTNKQDPDINPTEAEELVKGGFLWRTYTLGGPAQ